MTRDDMKTAILAIIEGPYSASDVLAIMAAHYKAELDACPEDNEEHGRELESVYRALKSAEQTCTWNAH